MYEPIYIGAPYKVNILSSDGEPIESGDIIVRLRNKVNKTYYTAIEDEDQSSAPAGSINFTFDTTQMIVGQYALEVFNAEDGQPASMRYVIEDFSTAKVCSMSDGFSPVETNE